MELSNRTAREIWTEVKANPNRARFGYGKKAVLVNIDFQYAYTRPKEFKTAYETDPRQIEYVNELAKRFRELGWPVVWTHVAYAESAEDAGVWGTRTNTVDSLKISSMVRVVLNWMNAVTLNAGRISSIASACLRHSLKLHCRPCWFGTSAIRS